ncbi:hypothetical protein [Nostoc parmelioides]|uniref:Uncharacterized protein n=1 Tax=Nostoc parmelioides FACHB-3921 TaxID=2692909 RepID=A0ABR8BRL0_9NOSO|nr:hypothetical protein [Nostoc parmelioides]MBD2255922.1 hypothetical protein [Nostoc parmelioides FACHB-3921]
MNTTNLDESGFGMSNEDWVNLGKSDAWEGKPKAPPEHDTEAASMYELGYIEGEIEKPPTPTPLSMNPAVKNG